MKFLKMPDVDDGKIGWIFNLNQLERIEFNGNRCRIYFPGHSWFIRPNPDCRDRFFSFLYNDHILFRFENHAFEGE